MHSVRKLAAVLACTALLTVLGATTAGAEPGAKCARLDKISERIEAQEARIAARAANHPRAANAGQNHKANLGNRLQDKLAGLQARCSG